MMVFSNIAHKSDGRLVNCRKFKLQGALSRSFLRRGITS
jgi:hypothetical protein